MRRFVLAALAALFLALPASAVHVATVTFEDQTADSSVTVAAAYLPEGGFVTIHDDTLLDGDALGSVVGTSAYLGPGNHTDVQVAVSGAAEGEQTFIAMPHKDTNGNQVYDFVTSEGADDGPYTADGEVVLADATVMVTGPATVAFEDQSSEGDAVVVASVDLPEGGFVTIHDDTLLDGDALGSVVGTSSYLSTGQHSDVRVPIDGVADGEHTLIAMPHQDTNGNQVYDFVTSEGADDGPYTADGEIVLADATIDVGHEGTTSPRSGDQAGENGDNGDPTESSGDAPGIGIALFLGVLAAAFVAVRRR